MKKVNMRKKLLAALLAVGGISGINDGNSLAVKTVKMKDYEQPGKPLSKTVPPAKELNFYDLKPKNLKTPDELKRFLDKNKFDIFYAYERGKSAQKAAYDKAIPINKTLHNFLNKLSERIPPTETEQKKRWVMDKLKGKSGKLTIPSNEELDSIKMRAIKNGETWVENKNSPVHFLSVDQTKTLDQNWNNIGRGGLNSAWYEKNSERFLQTELKWIEKGDINCTGWATTLHWFLNRNGIPAKILSTENHWEVCVPLTNDKHDEVRFYTINIKERNIPTIDYVKFVIRPLASTDINNENEWKGFVRSPNYDWNFDDLRYNPSQPLGLYMDFIGYAKGDYVRGLLKGMQSDLLTLEKSGKIKTDPNKKSRTYAIRYLPHERHSRGHILTVPLNVEKLGEPILDKNHPRQDRNWLLFKSKSETDKQIHWIEVKMELTNEEWNLYKNGVIKIVPKGNDYRNLKAIFRSGYLWPMERELYLNLQAGENVEGFWVGDKLVTIPNPPEDPPTENERNANKSPKPKRRYKPIRF